MESVLADAYESARKDMESLDRRRREYEHHTYLQGIAAHKLRYPEQYSTETAPKRPWWRFWA
jgi:hypothetical protein